MKKYIFLILTGAVLLSLTSCSLDLTGEKDKKITELEKQVVDLKKEKDDDLFKKKEECFKLKDIYEEKIKKDYKGSQLELNNIYYSRKNMTCFFTYTRYLNTDIFY